MPPGHSKLWGHLKFTAAFMNKLAAPSANVDLGIAVNVMRDFPNGVFYADFWPFSIPILCITTPNAAIQLQQYSTWPRPMDVIKPFDQICAGPSLLTMPEEEWRKWRTMFSPSFAPGYILQLAPMMAREVEVFCELLRERATTGEVAMVDPMLARLALDVVGATTL
jgi:sterigmatocystin biosynthesis cytochrome P450 monooxygenase